MLQPLRRLRRTSLRWSEPCVCPRGNRWLCLGGFMAKCCRRSTVACGGGSPPPRCLSLPRCRGDQVEKHTILLRSCPRGTRRPSAVSASPIRALAGSQALRRPRRARRAHPHFHHPSRKASEAGDTEGPPGQPGWPPPSTPRHHHQGRTNCGVSPPHSSAFRRKLHPDSQHSQIPSGSTQAREKGVTY